MRVGTSILLAILIVAYGLLCGYMGYRNGQRDLYEMYMVPSQT